MLYVSRSYWGRLQTVEDHSNTCKGEGYWCLC
uniref:Uncharacterized protein n=1 Tax=Anguilla anguilla TaxID=7936 RepID=A0A0E9QKR1_ANGAN